MRITTDKLQELKGIMFRDYGVILTEENAESFGVSMLRVYRLASVARARADEKNSSIQARRRHLLGANTST